MADYSQLDALKAKLDSLRPIDANKWGPVAEKFRVAWTYHSNALEGNPLNLSETSFFIREGLTSKGKPLAAYLEIKNHLTAVDFLEEVVKKKELITEGLIKQYHAMLFHNIEFVEVKSGGESRRMKIEAGVYKKEPNHVIRLDGSIHYFADPLQVPGEMQRLIKEFAAEREKVHPLELAGMFHHKLVGIHPFVDGNGRVARLLMNTILMQAGFTPAIIIVEEKKTYLEVLESADNGVYEPLFRFLEETLSKSLRTTIDVVEGRDAFDFDDLARMFRNAAEQTPAIEQELGAAAIPPEARSIETANTIGNAVQELLARYTLKAATPHVNQLVNAQPSLYSTPGYAALLGRIAPGRGIPVAELQVSGPGKRHVPTLFVNFSMVSGRYQIALTSTTRLGKFNDSLQEAIGFQESEPQILGSIYFEDWDPQTISDFVLNTLKTSFNAWSAEMDRRKTLIAAQEAEAEKFRLPRD